jgi:putative membrane protein
MKGTLVAIAILVGGGARAQASPAAGDHDQHAAPSAQRRATALSAQDRRFLEMAAATNLAQMDFGQVALQQGSTRRIRELGRTMANDHAAANERLAQLAAGAGITLPSEPSVDQKAEEDRLWELSGRDFDRAYLVEVKRDQRRAISAFRHEAQRGHDARLKSFARRALPTLQEQRKLASRSTRSL